MFFGKGELAQNALVRFYQSMLLEYVTLENNSSMQEKKKHELNAVFLIGLSIRYFAKHFNCA